MSYKYLDHEADMGISAVGKTVEEAFQEGAKAMFNVMVDIDKIKNTIKINIECESGDIAGLFIEWLNKLLAESDIKSIFFSEFKINSIKKINNKYKLKGKAYGEKIDLKKHNIKIEVKAATYSGLKFEKKNNKFYVQCILDV